VISRLATLGFLLLTSSSWACDIYKFGTVDMEGNETRLCLEHEAVERSPRWSPETGSEPPLGLLEAVAIGKGWASEHLAQFDSVNIDQISLHRAFSGPEGTYWFYKVSFAPVVAGRSLYAHGAGFYVAVLMEGTTVEPITGKRDVSRWPR